MRQRRGIPFLLGDAMFVAKRERRVAEAFALQGRLHPGTWQRIWASIDSWPGWQAIWQVEQRGNYE